MANSRLELAAVARFLEKAPILSSWRRLMVHTEFAIGAGRTEGDPSPGDYLRPEDVAHTIVTVLAQPRRVRTTQWQLWSMGQAS